MELKIHLSKISLEYLNFKMNQSIELPVSLSKEESSYRDKKNRSLQKTEKSCKIDRCKHRWMGLQAIKAKKLLNK